MAKTRQPVPPPPKKSGGASAAAKGAPAKTPAKNTNNSPAKKTNTNNSPAKQTPQKPAKPSDDQLEKQFRRFVKSDKRFAQGRYKNTVKIEFVVGLILIILYPVLKPNYSPIEWMKKMLAWSFIYLAILAVANTSRDMARLAAWFGGLIVLGLLVYEHSAEEGLIAGNIMTKVAKALMPSPGGVTTTAAQTKPTKPQSAWLWENWPWGNGQDTPTSQKQQNNAPNTTQTQ